MALPLLTLRFTCKGGILTPLESRRELRENDFRYERDFLEVLLKFREPPVDKNIGVAPKF